jgi:hypothetical protein
VPGRLAVSRRTSSAVGIQHWKVTVLCGADRKEVGTARATRGLFWKVRNLRERFADENEFLHRVSGILLDVDGQFSRDFEDAVDMPTSDVLILGGLSMKAPQAAKPSRHPRGTS